MARDKIILREDKLAAENLENNQFYFVTLNSSDEIAVASASGQGWSLEEGVKKGEYGTFSCLGFAKAYCGGTIEPGERVGSDSHGRAVAWATGYVVNGLAMEKGEAGQIISILVPGPAKA